MKKIYIEFYIAGDCVLALPKTDIPNVADVTRNKEIVAKMHQVSVDLVYTFEREVTEETIPNMIDTLRGVELFA